MYFALLVSQLPHVNEARNHYDDMLSLQPCHPVRRAIAACRTALQSAKTRKLPAARAH